MVIVAALVSRVEALVVASMLEAAGVSVFIGGSQHVSVQINSVALGGHRLMVSAGQHKLASDLLLEVLGEKEWEFCLGLRRAIIKLMVLWIAPYLLMITGTGVWLGEIPVIQLLLSPLAALSLPVNPQGRGDFYLMDGQGNVTLS